MTCLYCDHSLEGAAARPAFDPWLGRLWRVCPGCGRWNVVPLEARWEALESLERAVRDGGRSLLRTEHLDLVRLEDGEVVRVGRAPRPELALWRYGDAVPPARTRGFGAWLRRVFLGIPAAPHGYDTSEIATLSYPAQASHWFASPFIEDAPALTALFAHVPLAPACPSCGRALVVTPWSFQQVRLSLEGDEPTLRAPCAACRAEAPVPLGDARPALRVGLFLVNRRLRGAEVVEPAAAAVERADGPEGLIRRLARADSALGETGSASRLALQMALDESAEAELLEAEWRDAEEIAGIVDGRLTPAPALEDLRRRALE